jgi:hypothetical protein
MTKREQVVAGKPQAQVIATILKFDSECCSTTSLVRDGKTSLSHFVVEAKGEGEIPVPDIDRLLGVLKYHGSEVTLELDKNKLRIKSGKKQTTILADLGGLAFPHTKDTIGEWADKSENLAKQISPLGDYTMRDGSVRPAFLSWTVDATDLFEAMRCDQMNGQKLNRYEFIHDGDGLMKVIVGDELKGETTTEFEISKEERKEEPFEVTFEGGLDSVLKNLDGDVVLRFLDFTAEAQGRRLILDCGLSGWVYQASVLQ